MSYFGSIRTVAPILPVLFHVLFHSAGATADDHSWYGRINAGYTNLGESDLLLSDTDASSAQVDGGSLVGGAIGRDFGALRIEGEVAYRTNDISSHRLQDYQQGPEAGDFASLMLGLNLLYERNLFGSEKVVSYVGAGLAYLEEVDIDLISSTNREISFSGSDFGFQLMAGARYEVANDWDVFAELRYFDGGTVTLDSEINSGLSIEADYETADLIIGVGYRF